MASKHTEKAKAPSARGAAKQSRPARARQPDPALWRRVDGPSPYQCVLCHKQFQYLASIKIHARTHTGEKPHGCDVCGRQFALLSTLTNHRRLHSGDKPFKCDDCGRAFAQQSYLCVHKRVHSTDKPFCCEQCGKTFKQAYYLNIHKRFHSGEKPYKCDDCGKGFATVSNFYKHQRGHRGERQFCCEQCGKTFREHCQLRDHRRVHTGERPFSCDVCGMTFTLAKILARHARLHTGEKPYVCAACGKAFSRSENLRDHAKVHETHEVPAAPSVPPPAAGDDRYYMVNVMPVTDVQEALAWPLEVYRTETGVTVYKTLAEDGAALYQTETGSCFEQHIRGMSARNSLFYPAWSETVPETRSERADVLVQLFSPFLASQRIMGLEFHDPYSCIECENGLLMVFSELPDVPVPVPVPALQLSPRKYISVAVSLAKLLCGPVLTRLKSSDASLSRQLADMLTSYCELQRSSQAYHVEAVERLIIGDDVQNKMVSVLQRVVTGLPSGPRAHAFLAVDSTLVSLYSGRQFALLSTLTNHRRMHSGDKPFKCERLRARAFAQQSYLAAKTFKQAYYLNIHKRFHSGEKPYKCDDCVRKTFREHCQLRDHRRVHTGERPFSCDVCGMTFTLAKILERHARLHTGEKPYVCAACGKAFSRSENLRDHAKVHETHEVPAAPSVPPPAAGDDRYYMVNVMPVTDVQEALAWPLEVYRTETGVTVYKTLAEDGAALYQTETGEVFREMAGAVELAAPDSGLWPSAPQTGAVGRTAA
ncbi:zinc finger protein 420-like [Pollicipes pollicipes]|uniref:zinc finger protein 420-like n=1 Tax=Pollicipes pollicipes TaxID=41117 RepID=UPI001884988A|nr:zinc finger protein 420-like [Pollicipes pollicipes]